ncbi:methylisocitrate lyase [Marinoscillum sp. MHG1-6]|uniref:methylisocitrate lyase n=1 Tax=Marinoscillum sp. MHG1-6 TaxID=2959627 RepID=UPI0021584A45|nr:methylisocitrate lyase [Marinoscillum sp. MHG1-6]
MSINNLRKTFRQKLETDGIVLPGAFNALTALQIQKQGFDGCYISGAALSAGAGLPDIGLLTMNEFSFFIKYIVEAVSIPCIADMDTGFGEPVNVARMMREMEQLGLAGVHIEDQVLPKRCGHLEGKELITIEAMNEKIKIATMTRKDENFLLIARTDARGVEGLSAAIGRAHAYIEAGADAIFPEALKTKEEFETFSREVKVPLLANMTEFGKSPHFSATELMDMGYKMVIFPVTALRVAMKGTESLYQALKTEGTQKSLLDRMQTRDELYELLRYDDYARLDEKVAHFRPKTAEPKDDDP